MVGVINMFKKLFILGILITSLFGQIRELTDENFDRATSNTGHFANFDEVVRRFYQ